MFSQQKRNISNAEVKKYSRTPVGSQEQKKRNAKTYLEDCRQQSYMQNQTRVKPRMLTTFGSPHKHQSQQQNQCKTLNVVCRTGNISNLIQRVTTQEETIKQLNKQIKRLVRQNRELCAENDHLKMSVNSSAHSVESASRRLRSAPPPGRTSDRQRSNTPQDEPETPADADRAQLESESECTIPNTHVRKEDFVHAEIMKILAQDDDFNI